MADTSLLDQPESIVLDSVGNIYFGDLVNNRIRKINVSTGIITTIAGTGVAGYSGDGGSAISAKLYWPTDICFDKHWNLYVADYNLRIRKIDQSGTITTVCGNGVWGYSGDGGLATAAQIGVVRSLVIDTIGNIFFTDAYNLRKVDLVTGLISTIAGTSLNTFNGDSLTALSSNIFPIKLAIDKQQNLFFSDRYNNRVRKLDFTTELITTVAGNGTFAFNGDGGIATIASLNGVTDITFDSCGNLYVGEVQQGRIRKVTFNTNCTPQNINERTPLTFTLSPNPATSHITITSSTQLKQLHLINAVGVTVLRAEHESDKITIDVSDLPTGIYFLTVYDTQGNKRTEKVIKQ